MAVDAYKARRDLQHTGLPAPSLPLQIYSLQSSSQLLAQGILMHQYIS